MNIANISETPLVSVIIPCYNSGSTLMETVQSVQLQSYENWEIIIVNDGSTDNSAQLANQLAQEERVRVIHNHNGGVSNARNCGVNSAKGELLAFLDADDIWHKDKLHIQSLFLKENKNVGVCYSRVRFTSPSGKSLQQYSAIPNKPQKAVNLLVENHLCTSSNIMCRKQVFIENGEFDISMNYAEDQEWLIRVALTTHWEISGVAEVLLDYRTQINSLSSTLEKMELGWQTLTRKIACYEPEFIHNHYQKAQAIYLRYLARRALRQGEPAITGLRYMYRAIKSDTYIFIRSPWRSFATLLGLLCWWSFPNAYTTRLLQINK
jgi:glycosyltransferase involved in cell wall biosynthesis